MSWMKRRTPTATPSPGPMQTSPPVQMYNPNQHSQDWQQQQAPSNWYNTTLPAANEQLNQQSQSSFWQQPQQPYASQQQSQHPQQQHQQYYGNQQNNYYPQQQQNTYDYGNMQYGYQTNNSYVQQSQQQTHQPSHPPQQMPNDGWNSAWGWGDEDNSNNIQNANVDQVADTFTNDESWNWKLEESSSSSNIKLESNASSSEGNLEIAQGVQQVEQNLFPKMGDKGKMKPENLETVAHPACLPINRRIKNEALSAQWSIESQVSQESSDDILQTSESDKMFSRSSTISHSPVSGHQTPQEQAHEKPDPVFDNCENKEIIHSKDESDPKLAPLMMPGPRNDTNYKKIPVKSRLPESRTYLAPINQSVNLETVPDNSEAPAPDLHADMALEQFPATGLENNEVAPLNERNQYLETGQLSDENDALPPPGLSRMVPGQFGQGESNEPPPGLSRMVLGQTETSNQAASPPVGLHRMIPGESSSPEARYPDEEEASDNELQEINRNPLQSRSATIGADTPPAPPTNRHEVEREMNLDGANTLDSTSVNDIDNVTNSIRDLTVGENISDARVQTKLSNDNIRRIETDSEVERPASPPLDRRDRRQKDDGRREKRFTPDYSREGSREKSRTDRRRRRDRNYEDDTDFNSDKERDHRRDDREWPRDDYDKKYASLRRTDRDRDREPDRRRKDDRERNRDRDRDRLDRRADYRPRDSHYYYNRYEDDYDRSSRPSSRSDSMRDTSFRDRGHDRDRRRDRDSRRHRDPYNAYKMPAYPYDPYSPYYQQYQYYLENLRRTDPQAYAEWYRKYYQQSGAASSTYTQEEKVSVHSGRSSANDELAKERYLRENYYGHNSYQQMSLGYYREQHSQSISSHYGIDDSRVYDYNNSSLNLDDTSSVQRLTPAKFSTAHIKASIVSGRLVKILPHYPIDGQSALVELERLQDYLENDDELVELEQFPGPLVHGVTHKKTIIEYCNSKIRNRDNHKDINDPESYILMWELLILLIRQNGMVVGADIAELLMKDRNVENIAQQRPPSVASNSSGVVEVSEASGDGASTALKEEYITNKFREYLIYGSGQQALEWAMKHSLWGHALFLASKLDKRTYAKVMTRFANGLPMNDPLQTLYQLLSGHLPAAVTSVYDEKWGDWRPHLAMILSNTTQRPEMDRKAITTLGDTLMSRGSLYAAQFCYLMAEVGFSRYGEDGKLVLLGSSSLKPFATFAHNEAIHMTEIYEYACSLNDPKFRIPQFQPYKYLIATRLADVGFLESSLAYLEQVANAFTANPTLAQPSLINKVCTLADRLKYYDPTGYNDNVEFEDSDLMKSEQSWLQDLKSIQEQYEMGLISHESVNNLNTLTPETSSIPPQVQSYEHSPQDPWLPTENQQQPENWQQVQQQSVEQHNYMIPQQTDVAQNYNSAHYQDQQWNQQPPSQWNQEPQDYASPQSQPEAMSPQCDQQEEYWKHSQVEEPPRPQISMPNQSRQRTSSINEEHIKNQTQPTVNKIAKSKEVEKSSASTGWFGGIWNKLALRPKNQMKLPDDKNPTIVWDQEKKRWVNTEEDGTDGPSELKPPPKMSELMQRKVSNDMTSQHVNNMPPLQQQPQSLPNLSTYATNSSSHQYMEHPQSDGKPPLPTQNMFKMQRGRSVKKSYVDVFNPNGGKTSTSQPLAADGLSAPANNASMMNFFVPGPTDPNAPMEFLTPANVGQDLNQQPLQS